MTTTGIITVLAVWPILACAVATVPHRLKRTRPTTMPALTLIDGGRP